MSQHEYAHLARKLEELADRTPRLYSLAVLAVALLGYGYLLLILVLVAAGIIAGLALLVKMPGCLTLQMELALLALAGLILRSLWVKLAPPRNPRLRPHEAPELFELIDETRSRVRGPTVHEVRLNNHLNAHVEQRARLGLLGWPKNFLTIGLPLLEALPPDEFQAVLGHELAHLSKDHGRLAVWIYRVQKTWTRLLTELHQEKHWGAFLFTGFFEWYIPVLAAYSSVLSRRHEYEVDAVAASHFTPEVVARSLVRIEAAGRKLGRFWSDEWKEVETHPEPPEDIGLRMSTCLTTEGSNSDVFQEDRTSVPTDPFETHPPLTERLLAMGQSRAKPPPLRVSASSLLGGSLESIRVQFSKKWVEEVRYKWQEIHHRIHRERKELERLDDKRRQKGILDLDEMWRWASLIEAFREEEAEQAFERVLVDCPGFPPAEFAVGRLLLEQGNPDGVRRIEKAMKQDLSLAPPGYQLIAAFWEQQGNEEKFHEVQEKAGIFESQWEEARKERSSLSPGDEFLAHGLKPGEVESLAFQLKSLSEIAATHLIRKAVKYFPDYPFFVLVVTPVPRLSGEAKNLLIIKLKHRIVYPGFTRIVLLDRGFRRALAKVAEEPVYLKDS